MFGKLSTTKFYRKDDINYMLDCGGQPGENQIRRRNIKERILSDLNEGNLLKLEFYCIGNRELLIAELAIDVIVNELGIGEVDNQTRFTLGGRPGRRVIFKVNSKGAQIKGESEEKVQSLFFEGAEEKENRQANVGG
jgi:hypothetical protein